MILNCAAKGCENQALISYGGKFICGECMCKILERKKKKEQKEIEDLEEEANGNNI